MNINFSLFNSRSIVVIGQILLISLPKASHEFKWAEDKIKQLEEGCSELDYDTVAQRYISILNLYKYTDNPEGHWSSKCYIRFKQLGDNQTAKVAKQKQTNKRLKSSEQVQIIWTQNQGIQRPITIVNQKSKEETQTNTSTKLIFGSGFALGTVIVGAYIFWCCRCSRSFKKSATPMVVEPLLSPKPPTVIEDLDWVEETDETSGNLATVNLHLVAMEHTVPAPPEYPSNRRITEDQPPSYCEAVGISRKKV